MGGSLGDLYPSPSPIQAPRSNPHLLPTLTHPSHARSNPSSSTQVMIVPVMPMFNDYACQIRDKLHNQHIVVDTDLDDG